MKKRFFIVLFLALVLPVPAHAAQLTEPQIQALLNLLTSFEVPASTVQNVSFILRAQPSSAVTVVGSTTVTVSLGQTIQYRATATSSVDFTAVVKTINTKTIDLQRPDGSSSVGMNYASLVKFSCGYSNHVFARVYKINTNSVTLGFYSKKGIMICD